MGKWRKEKIPPWNNCRSLASLLKELSTYGSSLESSSAPSTASPGTGSCFRQTLCERFDTISWKEERDEASSQRNSLKTKREKHYLGEFRATCEQDQTPQSRRSRTCELHLSLPREQILIQGKPRHLYPHCQEPSAIWSVPGVRGNPAAPPSTLCPWSCSVNRWQMLLGEDKHQIMSLGGENKETEHLLH